MCVNVSPTSMYLCHVGWCPQKASGLGELGGCEPLDLALGN